MLKPSWQDHSTYVSTAGIYAFSDLEKGVIVVLLSQAYFRVHNTTSLCVSVLKMARKCTIDFWPAINILQFD